MQNEITRRTALLAPDGSLIQRGYAKRPVLIYNPENAGVSAWPFVNRLRLKEWDYYGVTGPDWFFSICVSHVGYIGLVFAYLIDFSDNSLITAEKVTPLGAGCRLPRTSEAGDVFFSRGGATMRYRREKERRVLRAEWKRFGGKGRDLTADLVLSQPGDMDSIVMVTPMEGRRFYYNHKVNCMPAAGQIRIGSDVREVTPKTCLGTLDWGRGVWPYRTFWNWGSASGFLPDGRRIGLNLGLGFGDLSAATENCLFLDGKMTKFGWVDLVYDSGDYMQPWKFFGEDGNVDLTLTPIFDRTSKANLLLAATEGHQMFGHYNGTVVSRSGERIEVKNLLGWAEEHRARW